MVWLYGVSQASAPRMQVALVFSVVKPGPADRGRGGEVAERWVVGEAVAAGRINAVAVAPDRRQLNESAAEFRRTVVGIKNRQVKERVEGKMEEDVCSGLRVTRTISSRRRRLWGWVFAKDRDGACQSGRPPLFRPSRPLHH